MIVKTIYKITVLGGLAMASLGPGAFAADASCTALIKATVPDPKVPYRVTMTMSINGKPETIESVYIDGFLYVRQPKAAHWTKTRMPDTRALVEMAQKSLAGCAAGGLELVGATPTRVWTTQSVDPFTRKPMSHKIWIGVADGRVYRQKVDEADQLLSYSNVSVPTPVKP